MGLAAQPPDIRADGSWQPTVTGARITPRLAVLVFLGGTAGSLVRTAVEEIASGRGWATAVVNLAGSLLVGVVLGRLRRVGFDAERIAFLAIGVGGGLTTFSTAIVDGLEIGADNPLLGVTYGAVSITLALGAMALAARREAG